MKIYGDIHKRLGVAARELRLAKQLSQEVVAQRADISAAYVGMLERGERDPTLSTLEALSRGLEVDLVALLAPRETPALDQTSPPEPSSKPRSSGKKRKKKRPSRKETAP